jgi:hypothetical protein
VGQASRLSIRHDGQDARPTGNRVGAHGDAPFLDSRFHGNDGDRVARNDSFGASD